MNRIPLSSSLKILILPFVIAISSGIYAQQKVALPKDYLDARVAAGRKYSESEVRRLADLGRLWGVLHFFNPKVNSGGVVTDSLALQPARILIADPSAGGFSRAVAKMIELANDGGTRVLTAGSTEPSLLFTRSGLPEVYHLADSVRLISFPTLAAEKVQDIRSIKGLSPSGWVTARAVIMDVRNAGASPDFGDYTFMYEVMPTVLQTIAGGTNLPGIFERRLFHNGFVSQTSTTPNIYSSGWQVVAGSNYTMPNERKPLQRPVAFIYNQHTNIEIIKQLSVLRAAGLCVLVYEGVTGTESNGQSERLMLADSISVQVRVNEFLLAGDRPLPKPDLQVERITDTSLNGAFIKSITALLATSTVKTNDAEAKAAAEFRLPRPGRYSDTLVPSADKRLFGLYNFWNSFHFFSPYKEGLDHSWDSIIYKYVPIFLHANDSLSYMLAVRSLASETQDCHGFINTNRQATPARHFYGGWPPVQLGFIENKVRILELGKDSSQNLSAFKIGDEVTHVDGLSIAMLREQWRHYLPTSNPNTYERDLANYLAVGPLNSTAKITTISNGKTKVTEIKRNGRWFMGQGILNFSNKYKTVDILPGNIGFVHMGNLRQAVVDSMMKALANTRAIIFDIRNYPQGTAWSIAPGLTASAKKAVLFDKPFVNYDHLRGGEDQSTLKSAFTVLPAGKATYKGKVIVLCDRTTQSQAEYSIMMFQGATKVTVVGSQTAGADGNVTEVALPGGYSISFSGLGIYYPDGTPTQRIGIKVDIQSKPTIAGLMAGKDEVLERAIRFINTGK